MMDRIVGKGTLAEVEAALSDGRKYLLNTERPKFVDVAFASLAAPMVMPEE
jgi:hypothetical protein